MDTVAKMECTIDAVSKQRTFMDLVETLIQSIETSVKLIWMM